MFSSCFHKILSVFGLTELYEKFRFKQLANQDPKKNANRVHYAVLHKNIDWKNPKTFVEKIYWLQLFTDTSLWTVCADKYRMRDYVRSKGLGNLLPKVYGCWKNSKEIDYDSLPDKFVLKTNNGCGQVLIVKDKRFLDIKETNELLDKWVQLKYGYIDAQVHYSRIEPCIFAEEYLESDDSLSSNLIDYKLWCIHGQPITFNVIFDRVILGPERGFSESAFDLNWNNISDRVFKKDDKHFSGKDIPKPTTLSQMIAAAEILSRDFIEVRLDFYQVNNKLYLGEMTFSTGYGDHSEEFELFLGNKIDLSKAKRINGINRPPKL